MKILLLSAYDADSHRYWRQHLTAQFPYYQWTVLSLPGRYFSWRIRGNSMSWAFGPDRALLEDTYDLIITTSMTDLSSLKGFIPNLANTPSLVYFHENQFAYPQSQQTQVKQPKASSVEPQILNLYTALSATTLAFNSEYNYQTFIKGATALLKKLPDYVSSDIIQIIQHKSHILPVPLLQPIEKASSNGDKPKDSARVNIWAQYNSLPIEERPLLIAWAARWEYDKGPDLLLEIIRIMSERGIHFKIAILGRSFRNSPEAFEKMRTDYSEYIDQFGFADSAEEYQEWLSQADIFISTALHEFQGLSVLEAVAAKCIPVLPQRLVYPEIFSTEYLYKTAKNMEQEAGNAVDLIMQKHLSIKHSEANLPAITHYWSQLKPKYQQLILKTIGH